jgi:hypothetical protein
VSYLRVSGPVRSNHDSWYPKLGTKPRAIPSGAVVLCAALGVLLTAVAYTAGRHGYSASRTADAVYWIGQIFILVPTSLRLLTVRRSAESGTVFTIVTLSVAEYLCKVLYSPLSFTYSDELAHWRTAENILLTGKLFTSSNTLPISPQYPGLEVVTTALVQCTGLPLFPCGLIVAGVAHLIFALTLYLVFRNIGRSHRLAGIAVLVYSSNPGWTYFDLIFAYETMALAFFGLTLLGAWHFTEARSRRDSIAWGCISILGIAGTVASHHVTSYMLVITLLLVTVSSLFVKGVRTFARAGFLTLLALLMAAAWLKFVAPQTIGYLWPQLAGVGQNLRTLVDGGMAGAPTSTSTPAKGPELSQPVAGVSVLALSCLVPLGWWELRRRFRSNVWALALTLGSITWYAIVVIRVTAADGSELSSRASSFVFVPVAFVAAFGLRRFVRLIPRVPVSYFVTASLAAVLLLLVNGMLNSWPPYWERLPGPYQAAGVERSVVPENITVADWTLAHLGPDNRFATDFGNNAVIGSYGNQVPVIGDSFLYLSPTYAGSTERQALQLGIHYFFADLRLSQLLPASGQYWHIDPNAGHYKHPLPLIDFTKFSKAQGVARVFDSGSIVIYDLFGNE